MLIKNNTKTTQIKRSKQERKTSSSNPVKTHSGSWEESRPEEVARAKKLLENPDYPSGKVVHSIARLLAKHLGQ
jgi:hypothetical protein